MGWVERSLTRPIGQDHQGRRGHPVCCHLYKCKLLKDKNKKNVLFKNANNFKLN